jgi:hypothetical protein
LAEALVRDGRVRAVDGVAELAGDSAVPVPESLAGAITSRLAALSADTVRVLRWAAVLGPEFTVTDLELVTGQDADELMRVVAEALTAGVVIEAGPRLAFRHGLIRQALHEAMPVSARSAVHLQAARAMAEAGARAERVAAQLAAVRLAAAPEMTTGWVADWLVVSIRKSCDRACRRPAWRWPCRCGRYSGRFIRRVVAVPRPGGPRVWRSRAGTVPGPGR